MDELGVHLSDQVLIHRGTIKVVLTDNSTHDQITFGPFNQNCLR